MKIRNLFLVRSCTAGAFFGAIALSFSFLLFNIVPNLALKAFPELFFQSMPLEAAICAALAGAVIWGALCYSNPVTDRRGQVVGILIVLASYVLLGALNPELIFQLLPALLVTGLITLPVGAWAGQFLAIRFRDNKRPG